MKKVMLIIWAIFAVPAYADDDAVINEIKSRYNASHEKAKGLCAELTEQIDKIKIMAGIGIGVGAVGTIGGGAATVAGIMKAQSDDKITKLEDEIIKYKYSEADIGKMSRQEVLDMLNKFEDYLREIEDKRTEAENKKKDLDKAIIDSQILGNVRTAGGFVAGAGGAVGAATSFVGLKTLDDLIIEMNACDSYVKEIDKQATELRMTAPDDPTLSKMNEIVKNCKGMSSKNIADVKNNMKMAGIIAAVGAVAGVAGGITSAAANKKEPGDGMNTVATISSGVAAVGNLGGAILSGTALSGLMKNGEIAKACAGAF